MSPKDDSRIRLLTWIIGIGIPLLFVILIAYLPIIVNNARDTAKALTKIEDVEKNQKKEFENLEKKIEQHVLNTKEEIKEVQTDISINKQNFRTVVDRLRDEGLMKNVVIIDRSFFEQKQ